MQTQFYYCLYYSVCLQFLFDNRTDVVYNIGTTFRRQIMVTRETTCCFSGHRPMKLPWGMRESDERCIAAKQWIAGQLEELYTLGYRHFICGMAIGCDTYFAEAVLALRDCHPDVTLEAAIPCADQANRWNKKQKETYDDLLARCDSAKVFQEHYTNGCMQQRNTYMVDRSSALLACYDGRPGGTMSTLLYAKREGLDIRVLDIEEITCIKMEDR